MIRVITLVMIGLALCLPGATPAAAEETAALGPLADSCTAKHGFDPRKPGDVAETDLAEGERAWRDCMYAGIESKIIPSSQVPDAWRALIAADRKMTDEIADGTLTRSQRAARLQLLIANIQLAEIVETDKRVQDVKKQLELRDRIEAIRRNVPRFF